MVVNRPRAATVGPQHQRPLPWPSLKRRTLSRRQLAGARAGEHQTLNAGVEGLVFTGTGAGQLSAAERSALEAWPGKRSLMLRANRCGSGPVHNHSEDDRLGLLPAGSLNPQRARVLLLLAVLAGWDRNQLQALITASP